MTISEQKTSLFFRLSISVTVFGALFQFVSWPLIILGVTGMVFFHTIQLIHRQERGPIDYARHFLIAAFSFNYIFSLLSLPYSNVFNAITKVALIIFILLYVKKIVVSYKESTQDKMLFLSSLGTENMSLLLADLATVYIVIASLFKILNWEFGIVNSNFLFIIGLFAALISIVASPKNAVN